jgi:methionyl-tRNA formyltransferase
MRFGLLTYETPLANGIIQRLLEEFDNRVVGILKSTAILPGKPDWASSWSLLSRRDRRPMAIRKGTELLVGKGVELSFRLAGKQPRVPRLAKMASAASVPLVGTADINGSKAMETLRAWSPDLLVSVNVNQRIGAEMIAFTPRGVINVHGGLLPRNRGLFPYFWALANGDKETGATVHWVDSEFDTGPVIVQQANPIEPQDTVFSVAVSTAAVGAELTVQAVRLIEEGRAPSVPQDSSLASYYSWPEPADFRRLKRLGRRYGSIAEMWRALS